MIMRTAFMCSERLTHNMRLGFAMVIPLERAHTVWTTGPIVLQPRGQRTFGSSHD